MNIANSRLLQQLQFCSEHRFTGKLRIHDFSDDSATTGHCWYFNFSRGRLIGNIGGIHPIRRIQRQFRLQGIELSRELEQSLAKATNTPDLMHWLLAELPSEQPIARAKLRNVFVGSLRETLFDILRCEMLWEAENRQLSYSLESYGFTNNFFSMVPINLKDLWLQASNLLKAWKKSGLMNYCPHLSPQIIDHQKLQQLVPSGAYPEVVALVNDDQSLWDIAVQQSEEIVTIGSIFLDYHQQQAVALRPIGDWAVALCAAHYQEQMQMAAQPLILHFCNIQPKIQLVQEVAIAANCCYMSVNDLGQSLTICRQQQPAIVLVDSQSTTDGYELCNRLHNTGRFQETPIILLDDKTQWFSRMRQAVSSNINHHADQGGIKKILQQHL